MREAEGTINKLVGGYSQSRGEREPGTGSQDEIKNLRKRRTRNRTISGIRVIFDPRYFRIKHNQADRIIGLSCKRTKGNP